MMRATMRICFLLVLVAMPLMAVDESFRIAECRARCLDKFVKPGDVVSDFRCRNETECFMCWDTCQRLEESFTIWGPMCTNDDICFPGCKQACAFHTKTSRRYTRAISTESIGRFIEPLTAEGVGGAEVFLRWSRPKGKNSETHQLVYVILRRIHSTDNRHEWKEVTQTSETTAMVDVLTPGKKIDFRVVAVSGTGVFAVTETTYFSYFLVQHGGKMNRNSISQTLVKSWDVVVDSQASTSLEGVEVVLSWTPPRLGEYVVVWEVVQGPLEIKGHLYTDMTTVTLTLERESVYRIYIELANTELKSEFVTINTKNVFSPKNVATDCGLKAILAGIAAAVGLFGVVLLLYLFRWWSRGSKNQNEESPIDNVKRKSLPPLDIREYDGDCIKCHSTPKLDEKLNSVRIFMENVEKLNQTLSPSFTTAISSGDVQLRVSPPPYELHNSTPSTPQRGAEFTPIRLKSCDHLANTPRRGTKEPVFNFERKSTS